jgi:DNA mismatch repair protein MutS2
MNEETLRVLEFDKIRVLLSGFTATEPGREVARNLRPLDSREAVASSLAEIAEMTVLMAAQGRPPVGGCRDLRESLRQLRAEGSRLDPENLLEILLSLEAARDCRRYFADPEYAPGLAGLAAGLDPLRGLAQSLRESIGTRGEILDGASFELGDLRRGIRQLRNRIKKILEDMLSADHLASVFQDRIITERGGRYVVPVRADHRGQIKGFEAMQSQKSLNYVF